MVERAEQFDDLADGEHRRHPGVLGHRAKPEARRGMPRIFAEQSRFSFSRPW
jgi:hypothetical protein